MSSGRWPASLRKLTGINPSKTEIELLKSLQLSEVNKFKSEPKKIKGWLSAGQYEVDKTLDPAQVSANAVVASVILNSDATLTKR